MDWNVSSHDQAFVHYLYQNNPSSYTPPLGYVLDGGGYGTTGGNKSLAENAEISETHLFNDHALNDFHFGYNYGNYWFVQPNYKNPNVASQLGLGGVPYDSVTGGGIPSVDVSGIASFGTHGYYVQHKSNNVYQVVDNVSLTRGNHSIRAGGSLQSIRVYVLSPVQPLGYYNYSGYFTSSPGVAHTGSGVADFLLNQQVGASISNYAGLHDVRWYRSAYVQDDWKVARRLTVNLGLRYDYFQPLRELGGVEGNFYLTGSRTPGNGAGNLVYLPKTQNVYFSPAFATLFASQNIGIQYTNNPSLVNSQKKNFAPRLGFALQIHQGMVLRGGYGIFFGGLENIGAGPEPPNNYPYQFTANLSRPNTCVPGNCATDGITLENGFTNALAVGLANFASQPSITGLEQNIHVPYAENYNVTWEQTLSTNMVVSMGFVGSVSRHELAQQNINSPAALIDPRLNANTVRPFPSMSSITITSGEGIASYNSLQAHLDKRWSNGLSFMTHYTWSHWLTDAWNGLEGAYQYHGVNLVSIRNDYSQAPGDVRQRITFNGIYELPFGFGRRYLNKSRVLDAVVGGVGERP